MARATYLDQRAEHGQALAMLSHGFVPTLADVFGQVERAARVQDRQAERARTIDQVEQLDAQPVQRAKPLLSAPTAVRGPSPETRAVIERARSLVTRSQAVESNQAWASTWQWRAGRYQ